MKFNSSLAITYLLNHPNSNLYVDSIDSKWYSDYIRLTEDKERIEYHDVDYYSDGEYGDDYTDYYTIYTFEEFIDKFEDRLFEEE